MKSANPASEDAGCFLDIDNCKWLKTENKEYTMTSSENNQVYSYINGSLENSNTTFL